MHEMKMFTIDTSVCQPLQISLRFQLPLVCTGI